MVDKVIIFSCLEMQDLHPVVVARSVYPDEEIVYIHHNLDSAGLCGETVAELAGITGDYEIKFEGRKLNKYTTVQEIVEDDTCIVRLDVTKKKVKS